MLVLVYLTQNICNTAKPRQRRYDLRDSLIRGLFLRVEASGRKTWYLNYRSPYPEKKLKNKKIIPAALANLSLAREQARNMLARLFLHNEDPAAYLCKKTPSQEPTLRELIDKYDPWVCANQKSGAVTIRALKLFKDFLDLPVNTLSSDVLAQWQKMQAGKIKGATVNRRVAALQALFSWSKENGFIKETPFSAAKVPQSDSKIVERFLSPEERTALMQELDKREERHGRDYLKPAVILSLNTGIRKGTLLGLKWEDVDFSLNLIYLRKEIMKGGKCAVVPINEAATLELKSWRKFTGACGGYIFADDLGGKRADTAHAFKRLIDRAGIKNFTWHCLRHDFASQLAIAGVPLHIIQRLLCHSSIAMTERYAHLSQKSLEDAVRALNEI